ncbi:lipase family protein [Nocardia sp. NPDC051570]|uniref:lipase family protein n=1 Tax=Nocardia sp. NPDC051570 TaxID=3364324 RepID=UPI00378CB187
MTHAEVDARPLRPDRDPFYRAPEGFERLPPGAVLRSRVVELAAFGVVPLRVSAWQVLYRTRDVHGVPEAAVTTVLLPRGAAAGGPLVSFQCAIDAVAPHCFPSYALRRGARALGAIPQIELPLIAAALARGWAVSVPDHGGSDGRFGVPREPGYRALDAVRAALRFPPLARNAATSVALWGYSGGGLATVWAAELAASYAPELRIVGAVAGSPVGDPGAAFVRLDGTLFAGFAMVFTAGLRRAYPELDAVLRARTRPRYLHRLAKAEAAATFPLLARFALRRVDCPIGMAALVALPELRTIIDDIRPGAVAPAMPMLVLQGVNDEVIAVGDVDALVERYVRAGARVRYLRDRLSTHLPLQFLGLPVMLDWLANRFAGLPATAGTETVWSVATSRRALADHARLAALNLRIMTGGVVGRVPAVAKGGAGRGNRAGEIPRGA